MERIRVKSSNIVSIGYDVITHTLEVEFKHGGIYQYYNVPENKFKKLMAASSKGEYFSRFIKKVYGWDKVPVDFGEKKK